jgi:hypothetical protein
VSETNQQPERPAGRPPKHYEAPIVEDLDTDGAPLVTPPGAGVTPTAAPRSL